VDEYIEIISTCSIVVMNHLRQQAVSNIVIMLYLGAKVFLDNQNPVYGFLKDQDAYIYRIEELSCEMNNLLTTEQVDKNRQILRSIWSRDVILEKTSDLLEKLQQA